MGINSFTPENIKQLQERQKSIEQLQRLGNVWVSPDIAIEKAVVVNPGELVQNARIILNKKDLPSIDITKGALASLEWSVRSFLAQTGIEVRFHPDVLRDSELKDLQDGKDVLARVDMINYGQRAVEVNGNVFRFFWVNDRNRLRGKELINTIHSKEFSVEGVEGEDWFLGGYEDDDKFMMTEENAEKGLCVVIRLKPEKLYIPYAPDPIKKDNTKSTRENLAELLKPIPKGREFNFEIGETPKVTLGSNIVGVINLGVNGKNQLHIHSPLIDPGSDWTIRTETLHGLEHVEFFLYKND